MQNKLLIKLSSGIAGLYSARLTLLLMLAVAAFFWLFNFSSVSFSNPSLIKVSESAGLLDTLSYYDAEQAYALLYRYGTEGRKLYLKFLVVDFMFIPVYAVGFSLLFTKLIRARYGESGAWLWLNLLPIAIGLFDCLENFCILNMLHIYPVSNRALGTLSGLATLGKTILSIFSLLCLGYFGIALLLQRMRTNKSRQPS